MLFGSILNNCKITERRTGSIKLQLYIRTSFCKGFSSSSCPNFLPPDFIYFFPCLPHPFSLLFHPVISSLPSSITVAFIYCPSSSLIFISSLWLSQSLYLTPLRLSAFTSLRAFALSIPPLIPLIFPCLHPPSLCPFCLLRPRHVFPLSRPDSPRRCDTVIITALAIEIWWGRVRAVGCRWGMRWEEGGARGALSGRHGRRLPWKQRDSASKGWRDSGGVDWVWQSARLKSKNRNALTRFSSLLLFIPSPHVHPPPTPPSPSFPLSPSLSWPHITGNQL